MPIELEGSKLFTPPSLNSNGIPYPAEAIDKRSEARFACNDPAQVRALNGDGGLLPATVVDISRSGLRLEIAVALGRGLKIEITLPREVIIFGEVRYCRRVAAVHQAGVLIEDVFYARRGGNGHHLHDHELSRYLARKGLCATELLAVREHLLECKRCTARHRAVAKLQRRLGSGDPES